MPVVMGGGTNQSTKPAQAGTASGAAPLMPFIRASQLRREQPFLDVTKTITTSDQDLGTTPVPAYGFLRAIKLVVTATGGAGAAVFAEDGPFSALKNIFLTEPNGAVIYQANTGYETYLHNKYGGYQYGNDPRFTSVYGTNATGGLFEFTLRIPVELRLRDGLGALPNQNAAATFMLRMTLASGATSALGTALYTTQPATTFPNCRIQAFAEYWDQPPQTIDGVAAAQLPPAVATTQFWTTQQYTVASGNNTIRLTRMGNYIRNLIFIFRASSTLRASQDAQWPDPTYLYVDIHQQDAILKAEWFQQIFERYGYGPTSFTAGTTVPVVAGSDAPNGKDISVWAYDFCHEFDGQVGHENNDLWLPTKASSRVEIQGSFGAAGTLTVLTNDIAVVGNVFM
jgi:hypothetical protein